MRFHNGTRRHRQIHPARVFPRHNSQEGRSAGPHGRGGSQHQGPDHPLVLRLQTRHHAPQGQKNDTWLRSILCSSFQRSSSDCRRPSPRMCKICTPCVAILEPTSRRRWHAAGSSSEHSMQVRCLSISDRSMLIPLVKYSSPRMESYAFSLSLFLSLSRPSIWPPSRLPRYK